MNRVMLDVENVIIFSIFAKLVLQIVSDLIHQFVNVQLDMLIFVEKILIFMVLKVLLMVKLWDMLLLKLDLKKDVLMELVPHVPINVKLVNILLLTVSLVLLEELTHQNVTVKTELIVMKKKFVEIVLKNVLLVSLMMNVLNVLLNLIDTVHLIVFV